MNATRIAIPISNCFSRYGTKSHSVAHMYDGVRWRWVNVCWQFDAVEAGQTPAETNFAATLQRHLRQTLHYSCLILPLYCHHSPALIPEFNGFTTTSHASFQTFLLSILIHQSQKERISVCIQGGKYVWSISVVFLSTRSRKMQSL